MRLVAIAALASLMVAAPAYAVGIRVGDPVAVRGQPIEVRVELLDNPGVVDRVEVALRAPPGPWQVQAARRHQVWWRARFAPTVWTSTTSRLEVTVRAFGARGGLIAEVGEDAPVLLDILSPRAAAQRARDLRRTESLIEQDASEALILAGLVAVQARFSDPARLRGLIGVALPINRTLVTALRVSVGPGFEPPERRPSGAIALGVEAGVRWRSGPPLPGVWTTFAGPRLGVELRFPGVDGLVGIEAGAHYGLSREVSLETALVAGALLHELDDGGWTPDATGGLRMGIRLGGVEP